MVYEIDTKVNTASSVLFFSCIISSIDTWAMKFKGINVAVVTASVE